MHTVAVEEFGCSPGKIGSALHQLMHAVLRTALLLALEVADRCQLKHVVLRKAQLLALEVADRFLATM